MRCRGQQPHFGPIHCTGLHRCERTGSVRKVTPSILISTLACPSQTAVMQSSVFRHSDVQGFDWARSTPGPFAQSQSLITWHVLDGPIHQLVDWKGSKEVLGSWISVVKKPTPCWHLLQPSVQLPLQDSSKAPLLHGSRDAWIVRAILVNS